MTRNRIAAAAAVLLLAVLAVRGIGSTETPEPPPSAPQARASVAVKASLPELSPLGELEPEAETAPEASYQLTYTAESLIDGHAGPEARLTGRWTVTRVADDRVAVRLSEATIEGHLALPQAEELAGEVELQAAGDGPLAGMGFPRVMSNAARRVFTSLATATWFTPGDGDAWTAEEEDAVGAFRADYARAGGQVTRTVAAYEALRGAAGLSAQGADKVTPGGETRFTFDAQGLARVEADLRTLYEMGEGAPRVESRVKLSLVRIAARRVPLRGGRLAIAGLSQHVDLGRDRAVADDALVGDATAAELLAEVARVVGLPADHPDTRKWRSVTLRKLAAAVRLDPAVAADLAADIAANADDASRVALLTGALGSANTSDATNALAGLLAEDLPAAADQQVLNHLTLTEVKTVEAGRALQAELAGPQGDAAAAALGAQAKDLEAQDPGSADDFVDALIERFKAAQTSDELRVAIEALGNSGAPRAFPYLAGTVAADDPAVARAAVFGLRFIPGDEVDGLLDAIAGGGSDRAITAVQAVAFRDPALWTPRLQALRAQYADAEAFTQAIDAVLSAWTGA